MCSHFAHSSATMSAKFFCGYFEFRDLRIVRMRCSFQFSSRGQAQPSKMKKKRRTLSEATQRFAPRKWEKSTKAAWKKNEKRGRSRTMKIELDTSRKYCYNVNYTAESSFAALNQGWPSSNFSATSAGNSASLGGCIKRLRDQWSGGLQGRPRAHTSLIQDSLRAIACLIKDPKETATRY